MLKKLNILNGELSVNFDPLNTKYTVKVSNNINKLELDLQASNNDTISIFNNNIINDYTEVVITVYNETELMSYYLEVYKDESKSVTNTYDYFKDLEINNNYEVPNYVAPLIASICFLLLLLIFTFLFKNNRKH